MQVIGIVGGVASGKSLATQMFSELGAKVLSGDEAAHQVLLDPAVITAARNRWGEDILDESGQIDRGRLGAIVFADTSAAAEELAFLEQLVHPLIAARLRAALDVLAAEGTEVAVLDAAVLLKAGWQEMCDKIIFLDAPLETRQARTLKRGWKTGELARREARQLPLEFKRSCAHVALDNAGSPEQLRAEIKRFWDSLFEPHLPN